MHTCLCLSVGWFLAFKPWLAAWRIKFGDDSPAKVPLSALCSDYGYVVGPNVLTQALEVLRSYVNENIVENLNLPKIDGDSQLETPPPALSGGDSQSNVLESANPVSLPRGHFSASATEWRQVLRRAVRADVLPHRASCQSGSIKICLLVFFCVSIQKLGADLGLYVIVEADMQLNDVWQRLSFQGRLG